MSVDAANVRFEDEIVAVLRDWVEEIVPEKLRPLESPIDSMKLLIERA